MQFNWNNNNYLKYGVESVEYRELLTLCETFTRMCGAAFKGSHPNWFFIAKMGRKFWKCLKWPYLNFVIFDDSYDAVLTLMKKFANFICQEYFHSFPSIYVNDSRWFSGISTNDKWIIGAPITEWHMCRTEIWCDPVRRLSTEKPSQIAAGAFGNYLSFSNASCKRHLVARYRAYVVP